MSVKNLYIASLEPNSGSLIISMGIMELLKSRVHKLAFFKPIIKNISLPDSDIEFMIKHFNLEQTPESCRCFGLDEVETLLSEGKESIILERLFEQYHRLESEFDFVMIQGLDQASFSKTLSQNFNHIIAKNLQAPYISVINGKHKTHEQLIHEIDLERVSLKNEHVEQIALFVNRLDEAIYRRFTEEVIDQSTLTFFMEEIDELDRLSVAEVKHALECSLLVGEKKDLDRMIRHPKIAAMHLEHLLDRLEDNDLIIVPGDRLDIILTVLYANYSKDFPTISAILLTGGIIPPDNFLKLIGGINFLNIPILSVKSDTYQSALKVDSISASLHPEQNRKIALAIGAFMNAVNVDLLQERLRTAHSDIITPAMFEYTLYQRARSERKRIVLPESNDERILRAAEILLRRDAVDLILLGERTSVLHQANTLGLDISKATIIDPLTSPLMQQYIDSFYALRAHKGLSMNTAIDAMSHRTYFATMMVYSGDADGMVSGAVHTTQDTVLPALQIIKTLPEISLVSSLFFMCLDTKVLVYADCAINQDPSAPELAEIAIASAFSAKAFGIEPRIAMLSYSTGNSGHGDDVEKVREATHIVKERYPDLLIEGPIQYDAAIDPEVALIKLPNSPVAGQATIFIFPDLNTGNNTYKAVQRSSGAVAIGPVLQGLKKPVNDLSRGCEIADIVNTVLITAIQAQQSEKL
ncbi:phosphotransacetylase [Sulfuricurvum kujiense DSM 16994]|uniref:Phosphate acetyltransferase n=1 Tax=Sulfuricurvum kujiense (strain ATCC BAA-921 / DSM 16994 / JCM 11577 / YK-1) TaxID=709032 RepID=E4TXN1_SULKY|nr:phosphate acetyltransferase [Sulfuricurvum kujiense]ADR33940.1 phosphotransacetylase [Sulfuricurvum kujiense DSM 16994]